MVEISGHGTLMIDGYRVENHAVLYWLDILRRAGRPCCRGSIHGSEELMRKVKKAKRAILEPEAGPSIALKCEGDRNGVRWMFANCRAEFSADPQCTKFAAKHLHSVVILIRFRARPIDHSLPWWEKYVELPSNHQTKAWVSMPGGPKSKPPPAEPTGVSNGVDDERRALEPGGPSRTLAAS
jgi:hypothetical protein